MGTPCTWDTIRYQTKFASLRQSPAGHNCSVHCRLLLHGFPSVQAGNQSNTIEVVSPTASSSRKDGCLWKVTILEPILEPGMLRTSIA